MKILGLSGRGARRWLAGAGAIVITGGLSGVALAADAIPAGPVIANAANPVIKGCFNHTTGALRVLTTRSPTCGSQGKISWNQTGNGYAFKSMAGTDDSFGEALGPTVTKAGTYFVNVNAGLDITSYTSGGSGGCALDITDPNETVFVFDIFSAWDYPAPASNLHNTYPFSSSGMVHVSARRVGDMFLLACFDNSFTPVTVKSSTWMISPVSATASGTVPVERTSTIGPAGFPRKPARKP